MESIRSQAAFTTAAVVLASVSTSGCITPRALVISTYLVLLNGVAGSDETPGPNARQGAAGPRPLWRAAAPSKRRGSTAGSNRMIQEVERSM